MPVALNVLPVVTVTVPAYGVFPAHVVRSVSNGCASVIPYPAKVVALVALALSAVCKSVCALRVPVIPPHATPPANPVTVAPVKSTVAPALKSVVEVLGNTLLPGNV